MSVREHPRPMKGWGGYNWGRLWTVQRLRKDAIEEMEQVIGEPWADIRDYCEVHKVTVTEGWE